MHNPSTFPTGFDPSSSILFLGSGFSVEATNTVGKNPPVGDGLRKKFLKLLELDETEASDLKDLAEYAFQNGNDVLKLLREQFTIANLSDSQAAILAQPWRRIYTTNYDDVVECFHRTSGTTPRPAVYSNEDPMAKQVRTGSIIHIHGYIHRMTPDNVMRQAVLSHRSYAEQAATSSPWWQQFERDIRSAENIFFVGYSLADFETASYLTRSDDLISKTHFILRANQNPIVRARIERYGNLHEIAVAGFAEECDKAVVGKRPEHANMLKSMSYFDVFPDDKIQSPPTPIEIENLFTYGNFNTRKLLATFPRAEYILPRLSLVETGIKYLSDSKTLIIHSKIGNGKTIFRNCLCMKLSEAGYSCFECKDDVTIPGQEVEFLKTQSKPVIVFSNYDTAYASMHLFRDMPDATRFVVEMNTGTLQVRRNEVLDTLIGPVERLDVNQLQNVEIGELDTLLDRAGIASIDLQASFSDGAEIRDIVLSLYENDEVAAKIRALLTPLLQNFDFKKVLFSASILRALDLKTDPTFLRAVTKVDSYAALSAVGESAYEFFDFTHDRLEPHSSLFSEYLVQSFLDPGELVGAIYWLSAEAAQRMHEIGDLQSERHRDARHVLGMLLTHRRLANFLKNHPNRDTMIEDLYERARSHKHISAEPLFWLQYSIFMQERREWSVAEKLMETAYRRGNERPGFQTYQLDTNSLSLLVDLEISDTTSDSVRRFERLVELLEKVRSMLAEGNHRGHALRALNKLERLVRGIKHKLSNSEAATLTYHLHLLEQALDSFEIAVKIETGSDQAKESMVRARVLLVGH